MCNAVGLFDAKVRFTYLKCKNKVKKVVNGPYMYAKVSYEGVNNKGRKCLLPLLLYFYTLVHAYKNFYSLVFCHT